MDEVHVSSERPINWYRTPLDRETLARLNERSDLLGALQTLGSLLAYATTFCLAFWLWQRQQWGWLVLALFAHGTMSAFLINAVHELVHYTVFKTRWLNTLFGRLMGIMYWNNDRFFCYSHKYHHRYTLNPPQDLELVNVPNQYTLLGTVGRGIIATHALAAVKTQLRWAVGRLDGVWEHHVLRDPKKKADVVNCARVMLATHALVSGWAIWSGYWIVAVLFTLSVFYGGLVMHLCNNTQHAGLPSGVNDFRINSRTILLNPVLQFLYWHMNFHIEHHMYAAVPCYRLPALHRAIKHDLPYCPNGIIESWTLIGDIMHRQHRDPNYVECAELPGPDGAPTKRPSGTNRAPSRGGQKAHHESLVVG